VPFVVEVGGAIDTARGREDAFRLQRPQVLDALVDVARIQSTEASNAIEDVVAPRKRIEALVEQKTTTSTRPGRPAGGRRRRTRSRKSCRTAPDASDSRRLPPLTRRLRWRSCTPLS
jgi:hypothetical protein